MGRGYPRRRRARSRNDKRCISDHHSDVLQSLALEGDRRADWHGGTRADEPREWRWQRLLVPKKRKNTRLFLEPFLQFVAKKEISLPRQARDKRMAKLEKQGVLFCRAPVVNLARDGRWGRNIETPGVYTHTAKGTHTHTHTHQQEFLVELSFLRVCHEPVLANDRRLFHLAKQNSQIPVVGRLYVCLRG